MMPRRLRRLLSCGLLGCVTAALVPLGCAAKIRYPEVPDEPPRVPDATAERVRECVDEPGGELPRGYFTFDATLTVDEDGDVVDVTSKGVPHEELAICMRIALRAMTVPEHILRVEKLRLPASPGVENRQGRDEREVVGHPAVVAVAIALAELVIEVGPTVVVLLASVELSGEVAEAAKRRPKPTLNRCLDAAAAGGVMWENLCNAMTDPTDAALCWKETLKSEQSKRNWCFNRFKKW